MASEPCRRCGRSIVRRGRDWDDAYCYRCLGFVLTGRPGLLHEVDREERFAWRERLREGGRR